jgi:hypothetical protein
VTVHKSALPAIWAAVYTALNVSALTSTLGCGVYDQIPRKPVFPYLRISSPTEVPDDTFGSAGKACTVQLHIFTSAAGFEGAPQAQAILSAAIGLLHHVPFTVFGHDLLICEYEIGIDAGDDDVNGVQIKHYVATFRVLVMQHPLVGAAFQLNAFQNSAFQVGA